MKLYAKRIYLLLEGQSEVIEIEGRDVDPETNKATWPAGFFGRKVTVVGIVGDFIHVPTPHLSFFTEVKSGVFRKEAKDLHFEAINLWTTDTLKIVYPLTLNGYKDPYQTGAMINLV